MQLLVSAVLNGKVFLHVIITLILCRIEIDVGSMAKQKSNIHVND